MSKALQDSRKQILLLNTVKNSNPSRGSIPGSGRNFLFTTASRPALRFIHGPIQWAPGTRSLVVKRKGREADHLPPSSEEIKNDGAISPFPHTSPWRIV
jgi:hypothetical protein